MHSSYVIEIVCRQEAQLPQTDRALLRFIEYFAKSLRSLKIIQNDTMSRM